MGLLSTLRTSTFLSKAAERFVSRLQGNIRTRRRSKVCLPDMSNLWRDHVIAWSKDLGRSIDYIESRPDLDAKKLAFVGFSWGASLGGLLPAVEPRLKACVLLSAGFYLQKARPEVDIINFAPRVKLPVLMLNGRYDFEAPVALAQRPMYAMLAALGRTSVTFCTMPGIIFRGMK